MNIEDKFKLLSKINLLQGYFGSNDANEEYSKVINEILTEQIDEFVQIKKEFLEHNISNIIILLASLKTNISKELFKNPCRKNWLELIETDDNNIKYCTDCKKHVFYVTNQSEFLFRKNLEQCVALNTFDYKPSEVEYQNFHSCKIVSHDAPLLGEPIYSDEQFY
ncbi:MAG: hypothetical protein IPJ31_09820 [Bacteroidetes bacterium]|jgi:hypothetical protein|nr:hypothetical protein [Bacteroidota bacterium]